MDLEKNMIIFYAVAKTGLTGIMKGLMITRSCKVINIPKCDAAVFPLS